MEDVLSVFGLGIHYDLFPPYCVRCQSYLVVAEATPVLERFSIYKIVLPRFLGSLVNIRSKSAKALPCQSILGFTVHVGKCL